MDEQMDLAYSNLSLWERLERLIFCHRRPGKPREWGEKGPGQKGGRQDGEKEELEAGEAGRVCGCGQPRAEDVR